MWHFSLKITLQIEFLNVDKNPFPRISFFCFDCHVFLINYNTITNTSKSRALSQLNQGFDGRFRKYNSTSHESMIMSSFLLRRPRLTHLSFSHSRRDATAIGHAPMSLWGLVNYIRAESVP